MNLNKVFIIGNLTRDPELKTLPSGTAVVSLGVATNRVWKDSSGQKQEEVEYHSVIVFGKQAEIIAQYLSKGRSVFIEGRLKTRTWETQDGNKRSKTEIIAERVQFGPRLTQAQAKEEINQETKETNLPEIDLEEEIKPEDLPF